MRQRGGCGIVAAESGRKGRRSLDVRSALRAHFESGCKPERTLGLELERFAVGGDGVSAGFYGTRGAEALLRGVAPFYRERVESEGCLIGLGRPGTGVSLEPGGQVEISVGPCRGVGELSALVGRFEREAEPTLRRLGLRLAAQAYHPKTRADELPLLPKPRYSLMYAHFAGTGTCGRYMMKGTASTQVSLDYRSEADCAAIFRAACLVSPLLAHWSENAPTFEGRPFTGHMLRAGIWNNVDPARCGYAPCSLALTFADYADWVAKTPPMLVPEGCGVRYTGRAAAETVYAGRDLTEAEAAHLTSTVFPTVRLRQYIELRMADSLPPPRALAFAALCKGLFYSERNLRRIEDIFGGMTLGDVVALEADIQRRGGDAVVAGRSAGEWKRRLTAFAADGLDAEGQAYLAAAFR